MIQIVVLVYPQLGVGRVNETKKEIISILFCNIDLVFDKDKLESDRYPEFHL